jgi:thiamine pyrophosphate-dependent acetolactate synthase large subunit-like protein
MMEAFGAKGFFGEDPKNLKGALAEAMNHRGPALVNIVLSQVPRESRSSSAGTADRLTLHHPGTALFITD